MNSKKIIFYFPQKEVEDLFKNQKNIYIFSATGFKKIGDNKIIDLNYNFSTIKKIKNINLIDVKKEINSWETAWSRFVDKGDQFELNSSEVLDNIIKIISFLIKNKIKKVFMFTASSHNITSLTFELACKLLKLKMIYFYSTNNIIYDNHNLLIPVQQTNGFISRKFINKKFSDFKFNKIIKYKSEILSKEINNEKNKFKDQNLKIFSSSFLLSFAKIFIYYFYSDILRIKNNFFSKVKNYNDLMNYSLYTHLRQVIQQFRSIKFYKKNISNILSKKKNIVIMAHSQPEADSYIYGQEYHNHSDIIFKLRQLGYSKEIYYKEHPSSSNYYIDFIHHTRVGCQRSVKYYKILKDQNCIFLNQNINSKNQKFFKNSLILTISGSIAIERSLLGLKTIYTGYPWWKGMPGTIHINKIKSLKELPDRYFIKSKTIARDAQKFICDKLNNKTIPNYVGMNGYKKKLDKNSKILFKKSINKLIKLN